MMVAVRRPKGPLLTPTAGAGTAAAIYSTRKKADISAPSPNHRPVLARAPLAGAPVQRAPLLTPQELGSLRR
jgi:hypothetical protein